MTMDELINVDYLASQCAQGIVKKTDEKNMKALGNLATKTLGVLQEQGVYAMVLFLSSRTKEEKRISKDMYMSLCGVLEKIPHFRSPVTCEEEPSKNLGYYSEITEDLDSLLLIHSLYEKVLIYTKYGAKSAQNEYESRKGGKK
jgi:hypothetical protein